MGDKAVDIKEAVKENTQGKTSRKKKVAAKSFSPLLTDFKLVHTAQIPWGTLYAELSKGSTVMEFAWADAQVILFMSTVHDSAYISLNTMPQSR